MTDYHKTRRERIVERVATMLKREGELQDDHFLRMCGSQLCAALAAAQPDTAPKEG